MKQEIAGLQICNNAASIELLFLEYIQIHYALKI